MSEKRKERRGGSRKERRKGEKRKEKQRASTFKTFLFLE